MKKIPLVHFIQWEKVPDKQIDSVLTGLKDMGVDNIVLHPYWWMRDEKDGSFLKMIYKKMLSTGLDGTACHGLWGNEYDLNCPDETRWKQIVSTHRSFMAHVAGMGCLTYTVHLGERYPEYTKEFLYSRVRKTLDTLLEAAEKSGIKIAMENMIAYDTSDEIAELASEYNHAQLGLCLDTGHAHVREGIETAIKNMAPYLVTCHLHDNNGRNDQHLPPGCGSIDWDCLIPSLKACPKLMNAETEAGKCDNLSSLKSWELFRNIWRLEK
jgi:sugar phosphate isomerase/epimerase